MENGTSKSIFYYESEGKLNLNKTAQLSVERAIEIGVKNILVFTGDGDGAIALSNLIPEDKCIKVHAVTFPYKQTFYSKSTDGKIEEIIPRASEKEVKQQLTELGINLVQGTMPLQDIFIPNALDNKIQTINSTLSLLSGGLKLCVQAILMATDNGSIEPGETVIAMSADTAIVANACISAWMFHPTKGLEISEIICKPSKLTITHNVD